jgi:hypothetical protein
MVDFFTFITLFKLLEKKALIRTLLSIEPLLFPSREKRGSDSTAEFCIITSEEQIPPLKCLSFTLEV